MNRIQELDAKIEELKKEKQIAELEIEIEKIKKTKIEETIIERRTVYKDYPVYQNPIYCGDNIKYGGVYKCGSYYNGAGTCPQPEKFYF